MITRAHLSTRIDFDEGMSYKDVKKMYESDGAIVFDMFSEKDLNPRLSGYNELTENEKLILIMYAEGVEQTEIARKLRITDRTVRIYIKEIRRKFGAMTAPRNANKLNK